MEEEFKISKKLLKTLTADTRTQILKALEQRPMTASELSRKLGKHVTTITEHLQKLKESDLVERVERPGRKWVYYRLTRTAKDILHPKSYRFVFVFIISFITVVSSLFIWNVDAYPGDWLYGLDRAVENFQLMLARNHLEKAKKHLEFAEERLKESKVLIEKGKIEYAKKVIEDYEKEMNKAEMEINKARLKKRNVVPLLESVSEATSKHEAILRNLEVKAPQLSKDVKPALIIAERKRVKSIRELENITGKPYSKIISR